MVSYGKWCEKINLQDGTVEQCNGQFSNVPNEDIDTSNTAAKIILL